MASIFKKIFDGNARDIKKYQKVVDEIAALEPSMEALSDTELQNKTVEFRQDLAKGVPLNDLLIPAFAVVREASRRVLGMRHFDVQLIGGMALHDGRISEMKTGEGKTLVATAPVYLNALEGKGVHVITVNDYLARRDSEWMGQLYKFLGLSVGLIVHGVEHTDKKAAYNCDITYGTNNEFGFDYLRDNMAVRPDFMVQRPLNYAIVDEVDSILVDEARTPLIISGPSAKPTELYYTANNVIPRLHLEEDYTIDEKAKVVMLTEDGVAKVEKILGIENLYDDSNILINHHVQQALKAHKIFKRDRDYVVKDGEVIIVDEFTGRLMFGRRYSEGLHQAIEAKENVKIERESQTLATITFQNYFRMYKKLAGMTGTAATEEDEFRNIYGLDVVVIPTNKPMLRQDMPDVIFRTVPGKFEAVADEIVERHATGQPILVGTVSIEKSEYLSRLLKQRGIEHKVLNAKFHEKEAEIVAQAGRMGAVTIATNMAGRGTDIILGGNPEFMLRQEKEAKPDKELSEAEEETLLKQFSEEAKADWQKVVEMGGLAIIGTERHESRRIDNQLRGRAGRQGDPGSSRFYISMDDDLMRRFGGDNLANMMDKLGMDDSMPIDNAMVSRSIESAQKKVEGRNFEIRKNVLEYDDIMNQQRQIIYSQRMDILRGEDLREQVIHMITESINRVVEKYKAVNNQYTEEWDIPIFLKDIEIALPKHDIQPQEIKNIDIDEVSELIASKAIAYFEQREERIGADTFREIERSVILRAVDSKWMDHIDAMDQLRQGIGLRGIGQVNPLVEYRNESYVMFQEMVADIQDEVTRLIQRVEIAEKLEERKDLQENRGDDDGKPQKKKPVVKKAEEKVGRNNPCPCGSGKKYKNCCGKNA
ncbi:MAG: preprotein translocase subunit SecA [Clostridia bacterium]|nr:preprotein translocase subunit SecA [Clostridia bacterium]